MEKKCTKCGNVYPATDKFFSRRKTAPDGLDGWCRQCHRASAKLYYMREKHRVNEARKAYWKARYLEERKLANRDFTEIEIMTGLELAYAAGLLDGEGCFTILGNGPGKNLTASVSMSMTHEATVAWLADHCGVSYCPVARKPRKMQYKVALVGRRAVSLTKRLYPFLLTKKKQAEILLNFGKVGWPGLDNSLSMDEISEKRLMLKERIRTLNA